MQCNPWLFIRIQWTVPLKQERRIYLRNSMAGMQVPQDIMRQGMQMDFYPDYHQGQTSKSCPSCIPKEPAKDSQQGRCACFPQETSIDCVRLAQAYVPFQKFCGIWPPLRSLLSGTIFPELYSPYRKTEYVNLEPEIKCGMCPAGGGCN